MFLLPGYPIILAKPERLTGGSAWHGHIPFAMFLTALTKPRVFVELGTHWGDSYCAFCQTVKALDLETRCFAVDTWLGEKHSGFYGPEILANLKAHHDPRYADFSTLVQGTFDEACPIFSDGSIDLLHIDGLHTYEAVRHDFETWLPKMSERAVVLLHDTAVRAGDFGVFKLMEELSSKYPSFEFLHGHGLGVVGIGPRLPDEMSFLFGASQDEAEIIRNLFQALGRRWELEQEIQMEREEKARLERSLQQIVLTPELEEEVSESPIYFPPYGTDAADPRDYLTWREWRLQQTEQERRELRDKVKKLENPPHITIVIPVYRPDVTVFDQCVQSIVDQIYEHWELILSDDASKDDAVESSLWNWEQHPRIRVIRSEINRGISAATNAAVEIASGEYIAFVDHDDLLEPEALAEIGLELAVNPQLDVVYTDEDKIDQNGNHRDPFCKPGWSPDYLLSGMYVGHLTAIRRTLLDEVGGLRSEFDGSQDHDLMLRISEKTNSIGHIPKILYHWRAVLGSTAVDPHAKPWAHEAGDRAVQEALDRRGEDAVAIPGLGRRRVIRRVTGQPVVSVIIPFRDGADMLSRCLESIEELGGYQSWEAILVNNSSWEPESEAFIKSTSRNSRIQVLDYPDEFNWSKINNFGVQKAAGDLFLFLNNDTEGTKRGWLKSLIEHAQRPEVGAVGARLIYPDGRLQHAGVIIGMEGISGHAFRYCPPDRNAYFGMDVVIRNYSAVTGACMMVRRAVYEELSGFDEEFRVAYNDIDFCLQLRERGYLIVYTPFAELIHHESVSRGFVMHAPEAKLMWKKWGWLIKEGDPYYNPNLSLHSPEFRFQTKGELPPWMSQLSMWQA